jgi:hypothetical protein
MILRGKSVVGAAVMADFLDQTAFSIWKKY